MSRFPRNFCTQLLLSLLFALSVNVHVLLLIVLNLRQSFELAELPGRMWGKHGKTHIFGMVETGGEPHFPQGFNIWNGYIPIRDYPTNEKKPEDRACLNRSQYFSLSQSSVSKSDVTVTLLPGINYGIMRRFSVFCWILWLLHPRLDKTALYLCENLCRLCLLRCASGCGCQ